MLIIIGLIIAAAIGGLLAFMRSDNRAMGKTEAIKDMLDETNKRMSDMATTDSDLVQRLRERAADKRNNKRKP